MAIEKKLICFARLEEFQRQLAAGNIKDYSIVLIQDANKIYNRGTYYDCQPPYVLPFDIETLDGLSYSDNMGSLQTDADVFEKAKSAIEMGRMVVIRYGLSDAGYHICDATYNGDAIRVCVYNGLMLYSFEIYASSQGSFIVEQYSLQSELVDGVNIATINGQSLTEGGDITIEGGGAIVDNVYITDFTVNDLERLIADPMLGMPADIPSMYEAMAAHKVVLVPYDSNEGFQGYGVATGYHEDLLYVTITLDNGRYIDLEVGHDATSISGQQLRLRVWDDKQNALIDGETIKTINGTSILGEGNFALATKTEFEQFTDVVFAQAIEGGGLVYALPDQATGDEDDVLLSHGTVKTINGESILGSGDIEIGGGETLTESDIAAMGFTKNTGTYSKPSGGIPKTDLASAVQTSLGKADTALQSVPSGYATETYVNNAIASAITTTLNTAV